MLHRSVDPGEIYFPICVGGETLQRSVHLICEVIVLGLSATLVAEVGVTAFDYLSTIVVITTIALVCSM